MWTESSPSNPGPAKEADNYIPSSPTAWPRSPTLHVSGHSSTRDMGLTQVPLIHSNSPSPEPPSKRRCTADTSKKASRKEARVHALSERQRWREANRTRHRKSDTMRDLIVQWDTSLFAPGTGLLCKVHETIHERLSAEMVTVEPHDISLTERLQSHRFGTVRFKRKVRSRYDPVQKWWEPLDEETCVSESTVVMVAQGEQVLAAVEDGSLADRIHANMSDRDQTQRLLLVIGLEAHLRHLRSQANRAFAAGVRQHIQGQGPVASVTIPSDLAREKVERALLLLQIQHRCHVVRAATPEEAAEWLYAISSDVSFRPYKYVRPLTQALAVGPHGAPFHQNVDGLERNLPSHARRNCTSKRLTQPRCTPPVSSAIVQRYPTLRSLLDAFEACASEEAPQLLARLVCDGRTQRFLGPQLSRRMYKELTIGIYAAFTSQDAKAPVE